MPERDRLVPTPASSDLPTFSILLEGNAIAATYQVLSLSVHKEVNRISEAEIILLDGDVAKETFEASNSEDFLPGKKLEVKAGYHNDEETIFKGIIVKHAIKMLSNDASVLILTLKHEAFKLAVMRNNRIFPQSTDSEAIDTILGEYNIRKSVATTSFKHENLIQYNATDWDFTVMRAEMNGLVVINENEGILIKLPDLSGEAALSLFYGSSLLEFEAEMDTRTSFSAVTAASWNPSEGKMLKEDGSSTIPEAGNFSTANAAGALEMPELEVNISSAVAGEETALWSNTQAVRIRLAKIRGRAKCIGFAKIQPGDLLQLNGVGDRFNGKVFVSGVHHTLAAGKWDTDLQFGLDYKWHADQFDNITEKPAHGLLPSVHGLQIGLAVQIDNDPLGADRVLVSIPSLLDSEAVWARVATLDAGNERGSFFRPEVGDELVLGFLNDDPRSAIILGMLNSSKLPAPLQAESNNNQKGFITRDKLKLLFDDDKKTISLETPKGNKVHISEEGKGITLQDENGNKLILNNEGITIESSKEIKIKASTDITVEGTNVELKAKANFKAEGSAGAAMKSSAITEVKGSMVNIN